MKNRFRGGSDPGILLRSPWCSMHAARANEEGLGHALRPLRVWQQDGVLVGLPVQLTYGLAARELTDRFAATRRCYVSFIPARVAAPVSS